MFRLIGKLLTPAGSRASLAILIYHRVLLKADPVLPGEVDVAVFDEHMAMLASEFNVLRLDEACTRLLRKDLPERAACITFDDGYSDNELNALPVLKKYNLTATFFVASGYLNGGIMFNDIVREAVRGARDGKYDLTFAEVAAVDLSDAESRRKAIDSILERVKYLQPGKRNETVARIAETFGVPLPKDLMMCTEQVRRLHSEGMAIGGHTLNHPILAVIDDDQAHAEIVRNKCELEEITGTAVSLFAYPNGKPRRDYRRQHVVIVKSAGYSAAVSTAPGIANGASDPFQLPRYVPWERKPKRLAARMLIDCARKQDTDRV